ncbi:acyltransferase [Candidatus Roizmanbacteria bacterium]|nr:acyltransferase [Candidatus Roizmanbacteria bacterium]
MKPQAPSRLKEIDFIRGFALFVMILIHTNAYFLQSPISRFLWDSCQFAVPAFLFCSFYLSFRKESPFSWQSYASYVKKRTIRLLAPYYLFLIIYFAIRYIKSPSNLSIPFISDSVFLIGGVDINWLILLFIIFSLLTPFIQLIRQKSPIAFNMVAGGSFISTVVFLFVTPSFSYKLIMWLPWFFVAFFTMWFLKNEQNIRKLVGVFFLLGSVYFILRFLLGTFGHSLIQFDNKYPPNLYHLSYGLMWVVGTYLLLKKQLKILDLPAAAFNYLSKHSYSLYFVHYVIIYVFTVFFHYTNLTWITFFLEILAFTILTQLVIDGFNHLFSTLKRGPTI